jgi:hypothetical protein
MDCAQLEDVAPELALGILSGEERAAALAHLDECAGCQQEVGSLTGLTDQLLELAPRAEPPPGFEERVLAALSPNVTALRPRHHTRHRAVVAALALAASIAIAALLWWGGPTARPALAAAEMRTDAGTLVGQVFLDRRSPGALFVSLPEWADQIDSYGRPGDTYELRVERRDGPPLLIPLTLNADAMWAGSLDVDPDTVTAVAVVDSQGTVWCHARFD